MTQRYLLALNKALDRTSIQVLWPCRMFQAGNFLGDREADELIQRQPFPLCYLNGLAARGKG